MRGLNWKAVVLGALVALPARLVLGFVVIILPVDMGMTASALVGAVAGFVAFALGGCVAGIVAGRSGGLNGLAATLLGALVAVGVGGAVTVLIVASVASSGPAAGGTFVQVSEGSGPSAAELAGVWAPILAWALLPFAGGYLGGKLGERLRGRFPS